jgi:hypothetical protein
MSCFGASPNPLVSEVPEPDRGTARFRCWGLSAVTSQVLKIAQFLANLREPIPLSGLFIADADTLCKQLPSLLVTPLRFFLVTIYIIVVHQYG